MNMKRSTPKPTTAPAPEVKTPAAGENVVQTAASTAMDIGGPVALEAAAPSEDLLAEFTPGLRGAAKEAVAKGGTRVKNYDLQGANPNLTPLEAELVQGMKSLLSQAIGHAADAGHRRDSLERSKWVTETRALIAKAESHEGLKVESAGPSKGLELTITVNGNTFGDLSIAMEEVSRLVGDECFSGMDSNDTGGYSFEIKGEELVPQKKLEFDVKLSRKLKDQERETLLERLQEKLDDHQVESSVELDGRKLTISCEGGIDEVTQDRIERSVVSTLDDAELSYTFSYELNDIED